MLFKLEGFKYATSLGLNMGYHIQLSKNASNLCTIILPWGKYSYKLLPIVIANYPEIFQKNMNDLFHGFKFICAYIDEILTFKKYWTYHLKNLELTLNKMKENDLNEILKSLSMVIQKCNI